MTLLELRQLVQASTQGLPVVEVFDYLCSHHHGEGTVYLPVEISQHFGGTHKPDDIVNTLNVFCGDPFDVLLRQWLFLDQTGDHESLLTDEEVEEALTENFFAHPTTGLSLNNFQDMISLTYLSTPYFASLLELEKKRSHRLSC